MLQFTGVKNGMFNIVKIQSSNHINNGSSDATSFIAFNMSPPLLIVSRTL